MKLLNTVSSAILATIFLFTACNTTETAVKEESEADFTQVIPTLNAITSDWNKGDLDKFVTVYDSAATFMLPKGPIGVNEMKEHYKAAFTETGTPTSTLSFDSLEMRPLGESHALVTGRYTLTAQDSSKQSGRYTLVFEHSDKGWKILHDHSN